MGYTPPSEQLEQALEKMDEGVEALRGVVVARLRSDAWDRPHKDLMGELLRHLDEMEILLARLR